MQKLVMLTEETLKQKGPLSHKGKCLKLLVGGWEFDSSLVYQLSRMVSMDGTIYQLWSLGVAKSLEEEHIKSLHRESHDLFWGNENFRDSWRKQGKAGPSYPPTTAQSSEVCEKNEKVPCRRAEESAVLEAAGTMCRSATEQRFIQDKGSSFVALLRMCAKNKDLHRGTKLHDDILKQGLLERCVDALVTMYAKCGALATAKELLDMHKSRDVFSWTALIAGYARHGQSQDALHCFEQLQREGLSPDAVTFACILKACGSLKALDKGKQIHNAIACQGLLRNDVILGTALVDMYAKCGDLVKAQQVLEELPRRNVVSWSALIAGYAQQGQGEQALICFERMQREGHSPDAVTFLSILKSCGSIKAAEMGERIHDEIARRGFLGSNVALGNALVDMYAKCGALAKARRVFEELRYQDVVSWNALISGYAQHGQGEQALISFENMQCEGISPDAVTFACALKACGSIKAIEKGEQIHDDIAEQGLLGKDVVLGNALVDMYAKCGALAKARQVIKELSSPNVVSWNSLIAGHIQHDQGEQALNCFERMQHEGISPDAATFGCILKACGNLGATNKGEEIHDEIVRQGLVPNNVVLGTALVDMYVKCGALAKAQQVLEELQSRDIVSWNALISGFAQKGLGEQALFCFEQLQRECLSPSAATFACILKVCGNIGAADKGEKLHDQIARRGLLENNIVLGTALVDMYAKCGAMAKARRVFEELPSRDVVSWSALIAGYAQQGQGEEALNCFEQMQREGLAPDAVTFTYILKACGTIGAADKGAQIHDEIAKQGLLENNIVVGTALVDMYAKCGALAKAQQVLEELPSRDVVSWSVLITGYAQQGLGEQVLNCFKRMQQEGFSPDAVTFSCVLNACSHLGLVEDGNSYFVSMRTKYGIEPNLEHYTCIVDLFGRAGHLDKAVRVIQEMPSSDCSAVWCALLGACQKWGEVNVGSWAFEHAVQVNKSDGLSYILMANIYAAAGMQEDAENIEVMRMENKALKKPGCSRWTDVSGNVHAFFVGDAKHIESSFNYAEQEDIVYEISSL